MKNLILFIAAFGLMNLSGCKNDDPDPLEALRDDLVTGSWFISELTVDNVSVKEQFTQYRLTFTLEKDEDSPQGIFNKLQMVQNGVTISGTWIFFAPNPEEDYKNYISIAFINNIEFRPISARWGIKSHVDGKVELVKPASELSPDVRVMVLEKQ